MPWWGWVLIVWAALAGALAWGWSRFAKPLRDWEESRWPFMQEDGSR